jgi:hypothetical protein
MSHEPANFDRSDSPMDVEPFLDDVDFTSLEEEVPPSITTAPSSAPSLSLSKPNDTIHRKRRHSDLDEFDPEMPYQYHKVSESGKSASWKHHQEMRDRARQDPSFVPSDTKLTTFQSAVRTNDPHAEFDPNNILRVRCSACPQWVTMRTIYDLLRWKEHRRTEKCKSKQESKKRVPPLSAFGFGKVTRQV